MKIGVDLDGVLADTTEEIKKALSKDFDIDIERPFVDLYELEAFGVTKHWIDRTFDNEWFWARALPYQENIDAVKDWYEGGHEIHLLTGRPPQALSLVTRGWVKKMGVPHHELSFEQTMHKIDYLIRKEIPVMFEDRFFEANKIGAFGKRSFIVKRPWNVKWEKNITNPLVSYIDRLSDANSFINEADNVGTR